MKHLKIALVCLALLSVVMCGKSDYKSFLDGKWHSEIQDMEFNFTEGRLKTEVRLMGLAKQSDNEVEYVETTKNGAVLKTKDSVIDVIVVDDNNIKVQKQGSPLALELKRVK